MGRIRFGSFDFDQGTLELRRDGSTVKLQPQPAQVLAMLLAKPDELVTREALREAVWGTGTHVDFERGLNFCVAQIRSALADSAESPRFVKTVPKKGYQFIAPVATAAPTQRFPKRWMAAAGFLLVGALLISWWQPWNQRARTVAVLRFDNETGSPDLDRFAQALTDSVVAELTTSGTGRYEVIGNAAILRTPRDRRDVAAIGSSLKAGYVVLGQLQRNGARLRLLAHLIRLPEQKHLWVTRLDCTPEDAPSGLAGRIGAEFEDRLGSSHGSATR